LLCSRAVLALLEGSVVGLARFQGRKRRPAVTAAVSGVLAVAALLAIPLMEGRYGFEGLWVGAVLVALVFGFGAFQYARIAVNPYWLDIGPDGLRVAMGGKLTELAWDEIDAVAVRAKPGERRSVPVLAITLRGEPPTGKSYLLYPRWSAEADALLLFDLEEVQGDPAAVSATCAAHAGDRWQGSLLS
jgi:hypothetical protein